MKKRERWKGSWWPTIYSNCAVHYASASAIESCLLFSWLELKWSTTKTTAAAAAAAWRILETSFQLLTNKKRTTQRIAGYIERRFFVSFSSACLRVFVSILIISHVVARAAKVALESAALFYTEVEGASVFKTTFFHCCLFLLLLLSSLLKSQDNNEWSSSSSSGST